MQKDLPDMVSMVQLWAQRGYLRITDPSSDLYIQIIDEIWNSVIIATWCLSKSERKEGNIYEEETSVARSEDHCKQGSLRGLRSRELDGRASHKGQDFHPDLLFLHTDEERL